MDGLKRVYMPLVGLLHHSYDIEHSRKPQRLYSFKTEWACNQFFEASYLTQNSKRVVIDLHDKILNFYHVFYSTIKNY